MNRKREFWIKRKRKRPLISKKFFEKRFDNFSKNEIININSLILIISNYIVANFMNFETSIPKVSPNFQQMILVIAGISSLVYLHKFGSTCITMSFQYFPSLAVVFSVSYNANIFIFSLSNLLISFIYRKKMLIHNPLLELGFVSNYFQSQTLKD